MTHPATIVLVACSKTKASVPSPARNLYTSPLFRASRRYAEFLVSTGQAACWHILSAKWGLVYPPEWYTPYEQSLYDLSAEERRSWGWKVYRDLRTTRVRPFPFAHVDFERDRFILLAGRAYVDPLRQHLRKIYEPLAGLGIGQRIKWLKANTPAPGNQLRLFSNQSERDETWHGTQALKLPTPAI